jgi:hypothetical protein
VTPIEEAMFMGPNGQGFQRIALEPNPAEGRGITPSYLTQLADFLLSQSRWARPVGIVATDGDSSRFLPRLDHERVLLDGILAIGERGYALAAPPPADPAIAPLDLTEVREEGLHTVFVCLSSQRVPIGDPLAVRHVEADGIGMAPAHRTSQLVLALESERQQYLDWLPVARFTRTRRGATFETSYDEHFHPPVTDLAAFHGDNALDRLVNRAIPLLEGMEDRPLARQISVELQVLGSCARRGSPQIAMLQAHRCLALIREARLKGLVLPASLENRSFDPVGFSDFMHDLWEATESKSSSEELPPQIVIDGKLCVRLDGKLERDIAHWKWTSVPRRFVNGLALYLPRTLASEIPAVSYTRQPTAPNAWRATELAKNVGAPGIALGLRDITGEIDAVYFTVAAISLALKFEQRLNEAHAIYYW